MTTDSIIEDTMPRSRRRRMAGRWPKRAKVHNSPAMIAAFAAIGNQIETRGMFGTDYRGAMREFSMDSKLRWLAGAIGNIANGTKSRDGLLHAATICWTWLESEVLSTLQISELVSDERLRQRQLLVAGKILFNCGSPIVCMERKLRVLIEELGEVAKAVDDIEQFPVVARTRHDLQVELVQTTAVLVAWLESMDPEWGGVAT